MLLSQLQDGEWGYITRIKGRGAFRKRLTEMGFIRGQQVTVVRNAPLLDPVQYTIMGYEISLRRSEASLIEVYTGNDFVPNQSASFNGTLEIETTVRDAENKGKSIHVALVGNPNSGKTTLYNLLSNSTEHVGNYSGVTIESKKAIFEHGGYLINITDLPGTYSLTAYSPEELYVREYLAETMPDVVINVVDGSNLERNLYLTTQLIDMDIRVVVALNMYDELTRSGDKIDFASLGTMLGIPFIPTVGRKRQGMNALLDKVISVFEDKETTSRHIHINYGEELEQSINAIQKTIKVKENFALTDTYSSRFLSVKLLEKDQHAQRLLSSTINYNDIARTSATEIQRIEKLIGEDAESLVTDAKYGFIAGALRETYQKNPVKERKETTIIDNILTNRILGFPFFLLILWLMFQATFNLGQYPKHWIEQVVSLLGNFVMDHLAEGEFKDLLVHGIIDGVGGVIVFLPNILIMFLFISLMEDTGYMARAAFIMDKLMHKIGLHGRSFIPLVMGFGCNVPAIMATRTIENKNNRLITILINPFMSCSARLPVYILLIGAFFPKHPGTVLFALYSTGILLAILVALLLKKLVFKGEDLPFVMELPPYRIPTVRVTIRHMWARASQYLKKMGGVILVASILIWALGHYPRHTDYSKNYSQMEQNARIAFEPLIASYGAKGLPDSAASLRDELALQLDEINLEKRSEQQEYSLIGRIGHGIEPLIKPLGFDWKIGISLLSGVAAKEIVVSTLGVLYQAEPTRDGMGSLAAKLKEQKHMRGELAGSPVFTPLVAFALMLFILIYFPCIAVIASIRNETGSWKWALFTVVYTSGIAWLVSFAVYQTGRLFL